MVAYDLTTRLIPFLDRHLALPLLNYLTDLDIYNQNQLQSAQYELVKGTNMVDYASQINPHESQDDKKKHIVDTQQQYQQKAKEVLEVLTNPDVSNHLTQDKHKNREILQEKFNLQPNSIEVLYDYGHFQFSSGNYVEAAEYLYHFRILSTEPAKVLSSQWGILASNILKGSFDQALEDFNGLREMIDRQHSQDKGTVIQLQQRTWLLHWGLFIFFNHEQGRDVLVDLLSHTAYLNTLQTACPWLLRYYTIAVIATSRQSQRQKSLIRDLIRVVNIETYQYQDPLTKFVEALYTDFDFNVVEAQLKEIDTVFTQDFFLSNEQLKDDFFSSARFYVVEAYCRIHSHVTISEIAQKVGLSEDAFKSWISKEEKFVVDSNAVYIPTETPNVLSTILDKSSALALRSQSIKQAITTYHIYALLRRQKAYAGIHFENVDEDDGEGGEDEVCYCLSVDNPPKEIRVVSLGGISRSVVCVDNSGVDNDIRTVVVHLDKYFNVGAFPVKRQTLYRAFRSTDSGEQENRLSALAHDLEVALFRDNDLSYITEPADKYDIGTTTHVPDNGREKDKNESVSSLLQSQRSSHAIATPQPRKSSQEKKDRNFEQVSRDAQANIPSPPASQDLAPNIGGSDLDPFQSFNNPPSGIGLGNLRQPGTLGGPSRPSGGGMHPTPEELFAQPPEARYDPIGPVFGPGGSMGVQPPFNDPSKRSRGPSGGFGGVSFGGDPDFDEPMPPGSVS
ncbi:hypothetical protein E3Q05_04290 [Wallemia mellicola]|nr:hypothetical protein E3Q05_04290 [Wallemia mellicola]